MYGWSNGTGVYKGIHITQCIDNKREELNVYFGSKEPPKKIYIKGDCLICLTKDGRVFKKGQFIFEDQTNKKEVTEISFPDIDPVEKIKFGQSHILFLTSKGYVYSMGNNYYGQLGINNMMVPVIYTPQKLKADNQDLICKYIHAYRNNSFAIDKKGQLYIWGKNDYLMGIYKSNIFHPTVFLTDFKVESIKHSCGRMVIYAKKEEEVVERRDIEDDDENDEEAPENQDEEKKGDKENDQEEDDNFRDSNANISARNTLKKAMQVKEVNNYHDIQIPCYVNTMNDFILKITEDKALLQNIKSYILTGSQSSEFLEKENIEKMWKEVLNMIKNAVTAKAENFLNSQTKISYAKGIELFISIFGVYLNKFYSKIQLNLLRELFDKQVKDCSSLAKDVSGEKNQSEDENIFTDNLRNLFVNAFKYKKVENSIHQFSVHQHLIRLFDYSRMKDLLEGIISELKENETKTFLYEKLYENLLIIPVKYTQTIDIVESYFGNSKGNEQFLAEYLIETNRRIKDLFKYYLYHSKENEILSIRINELTKIYGHYKKLYSFQRLLENITDNVDHLRPSIKNVPTVASEDINDIKRRYIELEKENLIRITQYDKIYDDIIDYVSTNIKNENEDLTKILVSNYCTSLADLARLKKMLCSMVISLHKEYEKNI